MNRLDVSGLMDQIFTKGSQLGGLFFLAMFLGGPKVRQDFQEMTLGLAQVSSRVEFRQWLIRSHYRMVDQTKVNWKPISMFPEEAKRFK